MSSRRLRPDARRAPLPKLFVLDTNVLMHDPTSLFRFEEHDVYLPIMTLEELDNNKKRHLGSGAQRAPGEPLPRRIVSQAKGSIEHGIPLKRHAADNANGRLFLQTEAINGHIPANLPIGKNDNHIIGVLIYLQKKQPQRQVILVSKDINMRIKARALGLHVEDYFSDKVLEDTDLLYTVCGRWARTSGTITART
jgi:PhoH-like ATPase